MPGAITSNVERTKEVYQVFGEGDVDRLVNEFWDPEIEWIEPAGSAYGGRYVGAEAILQNVFPKIGEQWGEEFRPIPETFLDAGDTVVVQGTATGKKNGQEYSVPFCHVLRLKDGKFTYYQQYCDTASVP